jgi:hypothetical protein
MSVRLFASTAATQTTADAITSVKHTASFITAPVLYIADESLSNTQLSCGHPRLTCILYWVARQTLHRARQQRAARDSAAAAAEDEQDTDGNDGFRATADGEFAGFGGEPACGAEEAVALGDGLGLTNIARQS